MKVKLADLEEKVAKGVAKLGYEGDDATAIVEVLLYAEMRGNNQGIPKIATGGVPNASDVEPFSVAKENKAGALLSGGHSMATSAKAADTAVSLASEHGVGIVGVNHTHTSSGAIGYFVRRIAKAGYIGFMTTGNGSFRAVAPWGSAEGQLGTNPFAYAFPHSGGELVFDNATAAIAFFGLVEAKLKGEPVGEGLGYDAEGNPSTDPSAIMDGAIATFAGHKGFGLSLFVQIMGSAFAHAGSPGVNEDDGAGTMIMAIDPALLSSKEEYLQRIDALLQNVKGAKPLPGQQVILPGEQGDAMVAEVTKSGEIEIADAIWNELQTFIEE